MTFDFYTHLAALQACPTDGTLPGGLASGFVDGCTVWFASNDISAAKYEALLANEKDKQRRKELHEKKRKHEDAKNNARRCYIQRARAERLQRSSTQRLGNSKASYIQRARAERLQLPDDPNLDLDPWPSQLLHADCLAIKVEFELLTPWYSKDDRPFHVLDNPVRKDRVFGVPFIAAASWKGMLRWACRMQAGLRQHLEEGKRFDAWTDPDWILHLFGNEKGKEDHEKLRQGALVFYPTWFDKIGFEVINPHDRGRRAGTQPIYYEVVPGKRPGQDGGKRPGQDGGKGTLHLLYAPWPGMNPAAAEEEWLPKLLEAIEDLLTRYGISAKRTVGWGTAEIKKWRARRDNQPIEADSRDELVHKLGLDAGGGS
jgi:CRISPR-associated protein Cmr2